jgi:hypothetical protein
MNAMLAQLSGARQQVIDDELFFPHWVGETAHRPYQQSKRHQRDQHGVRIGQADRREKHALFTNRTSL